MRRREFVKNIAIASGMLSCHTPFGFGTLIPPSSSDVRQVLVVFLCHLDVGFTGTQAAVVNKYFTRYFPAAIQVADAMRQSGEDRYVWSTGSWLLYEYLDWVKGAAKARAEQAVEKGDLAWFGVPFNWQSEMLDRSMIEGALGISHTLDRRFGRTTIGAKMSDVPGHTRGLVAPLAANGIKLLDIGVNGASTVPEVPPIFVWREPEGGEIIMMYHHGYGGVIQIPGSDLAVAVEVRNDNDGPHSLDEAKSVYAALRKQFPNAKITAASFSEVAKAAEPYRSNLPVVTQEIGDTWIYGVASDPIKVARYREIMRLRKEWIAHGRIRVGDPTDIRLLLQLLLAPEHTWGVDTKRLKDYEHYTPKDLASVLDSPRFRWAAQSWAEKRKDIDEAVGSLPLTFRNEAEAQLRSLTPTVPNHEGLDPHEPGSEMATEHFIVALDPKTGAIHRLREKKTGREWSSPEHPLGLFAYQTLSAEDYERYRAAYIMVKTWWSPMDFGKPGIEKLGAESRVWLPGVAGCWSGSTGKGTRILTQLQITDEEAVRSGRVAWPRKIFLDMLFPDSEPVVRLTLTCLEKAANRLPEGMWFSFIPAGTRPDGWKIEKASQRVSPFDVVKGGNRHMHAVTTAIHYSDARGSLSIETLDAPVVALGEKSPIFYSNDQPDLAKGFHFSLYNNAWGTNYIQWFGEDTRFRFTLRV